jgi:acetate kinase
VKILVVNAGSSSLKLSVLAGDDVLAARSIERWDGDSNLTPVCELLEETGPVDAVGHRVVHGGPHHAGPARIDKELINELSALTELAPLHQPRVLAAIDAVSALLPKVNAVACFDTAFHHTLPAAAATYALPAAWNERWGLRRYGFHGLSHAYAAGRAAEIIDRPPTGLRIVSCHLGAGASLCAVVGGISVDTTMGFTPLAGLVMATRSGSVDPGVLLWLLHTNRVGLDELADALEHRSGMAGLSGTSGDMRDILAARDRGEPAAVLAYDVFVHRLAREVGAMAASCGGLDLLAITGGIGENAPVVRADLAGRLRYLGVVVDAARNEAAAGDADVSANDAVVRTVVVTAGEDRQVAREVTTLLDGRRQGMATPDT